MRAVLAVAGCAAIVATAATANHIRAVIAGPRCSVTAVTERAHQDPDAVTAYWTQDRRQQARQNMRNAAAATPSARRGCRAVP